MGDKVQGSNRGRVIGTITLGSAGLLTIGSALLFLMGYQINSGYFSEFGIPIGSLDLSATFHLLALRSPVFLVVFACWWIGVFFLLFAFLIWMPPKRGRINARAVIPIAIGAILFILSTFLNSSTLLITSFIWLTIVFALRFLLTDDVKTPTRLDTVLTRAQVRPYRAVLVITSAFSILLVGFSLLFREYGKFTAHSQMVVNSQLSEIAIYSLMPLPIPDPTPVFFNGESEQQYRYDGLRLIIYNGQQYFVFRPTDVVDNRPLVYVVPADAAWIVEMQNPVSPADTPAPTPVPSPILTMTLEP